MTLPAGLAKRPARFQKLPPALPTCSIFPSSQAPHSLMCIFSAVVDVLSIGALTSSLLLYLAYKAGLDCRTGETAEHVISFHARSSDAVVIH